MEKSGPQCSYSNPSFPISICLSHLFYLFQNPKFALKEWGEGRRKVFILIAHKRMKGREEWPVCDFLGFFENLKNLGEVFMPESMRLHVFELRPQLSQEPPQCSYSAVKYGLMKAMEVNINRNYLRDLISVSEFLVFCFTLHDVTSLAPLKIPGTMWKIIYPTYIWHLYLSIEVCSKTWKIKHSWKIPDSIWMLSSTQNLTLYALGGFSLLASR